MNDRPTPGHPDFRNFIGARLVRLATDEAVLDLDLSPPFLNYTGSLHGGVIASMIDMAGALAGGYINESVTIRRALTLSIAVTFLSTVTSGRIRATGRKTGGGRKIFGATIEVHDGSGQVVATGQGTYKYVDPFAAMP